jgi:hypothetical protein
MLDFKYEVVNHALRHGHLTIHKETQGNEVGIPVVELPSNDISQ